MQTNSIANQDYVCLIKCSVSFFWNFNSKWCPSKLIEIIGFDRNTASLVAIWTEQFASSFNRWIVCFSLSQCRINFQDECHWTSAKCEATKQKPNNQSITKYIQTKRLSQFNSKRNKAVALRAQTTTKRNQTKPNQIEK